LGLLAVIIGPFAFSGPSDKVKVVLLGSPEVLPASLENQFRSLNLEHVSPCRLKRPEISRRAASADADEVAGLAPMRRWFFARKPDAGFVLTGFPATLLQARVLDEWLESRDESLDAVISVPGAEPALIEHYRTLGLLHGGASPAQP
jgi:adenylate kinase